MRDQHIVPGLQSMPTEEIVALVKAGSAELARRRTAGAPTADPVGTVPLLEAGEYMRQTEVCRLLGVSRTTLWEWRRAEGELRFPVPVPHGPRGGIAWRRIEVEAWRARRDAAALKPPKPPKQR